MKYRPDIDGLRTLAVVPVVLFHAGLGFPGGYVGVDVFFVISGFLITSLLLQDLGDGRFSILRFYERRARRIFPALFVMLAVALAVGTAMLLPFDLDSLARSAAAAALFLSNVWFYTQQGYFTEAAELQPLLHTWSLGVEEQYYLVFPPLLWLGFRWLRRAGAVFLALLALALLSFAAALWAVGTAPAAAFYLPQYRAWELFLGSLLAIAAQRGWTAPLFGRAGPATLAGAAGLVLILVPVFAYGPETAFPGLAALPPCAGAALLIAAGLHRATPAGRLLALAPMVWIGKLSYSLYLWHWPVLVFAYHGNGAALTPLQGLGCALLAVLLAWLSLRYVERPFRDPAGIGRRAIFAGSAVAICVTVGIGATLARLDGLPGRMAPEVAALLDRGWTAKRRTDSCYNITPARARAGDICIRGTEGAAPSFLFAGDSHAWVLSDALFEAAGQAGLSGYQFADPGFRPLLEVAKRGDPRWSALPPALVDFLLARPEIRTVVITAFWQHQMTGYSYRHEGDLWTDAAYDGSGSAYSATATLHGLERLAEALPGRHFVLLDDVPTGQEFHVRAQAWAVRDHTTATAGMSAGAARAQRATYEPLLAEFAATHPAFRYERILQTTCGPELCPLFDGATPLYRDGDHLNGAGAARLVPKLTALFSETLAAGE